MKRARHIWRAMVAALVLAAAVAPARALTIAASFDQTWQDQAPPEATAAVRRAIAFWEGTIRNPGTVPIEFCWNKVPSQAMLGFTSPPARVTPVLTSEALDMLRRAAKAQPANWPLAMAVANLSEPPFPVVLVADAQFVALTGGLPPTGNPVAGSIGFNANPPGGWDFGEGPPAPGRFSFQADVEAEISHVLGRADLALLAQQNPGMLFVPTLLNLYKYRCGTKELELHLGNSCLSIDGGTNQVRVGSAGVFDVTADSSGWRDDSCAGKDLFDACLAPGVRPRFSDLDRVLMCALGWDACVAR